MMRAGTGRAFFLCFSNSLARRFGRASLVLLLLAPQVAQAQKILDFVCEFATVTVGSQPSEDGDIRPGDWMILSAEAPVDRPPTNGSPIPGGAAVYWDLERQNECSHVPPNGAVTSGVADLSRAIVEDAAFDAVGWDSIGSFFTLGASEVTRCGMGLRDDDGQSFDVVNFPDPLTLEGWTTNVCYFEGASGGQTVTALGPAELIVDRSQIGDLVTLDVPYGDTKALIAAVIWANENQSQDRFQFTRIRFTGAHQEFVFDAPFGGSDHALPVITSSIEFRDSGTFRFGVQSLRSYRFAKLEGDGWLIVRDATIAAFQGPGGGGAILLTGQSQFAGNGQFSDNFSDGDGGFALVQGEAGISLIDSDVSGNETEGNGGAIALAGQASASIFDGVSGETTFQGNMAAGSGGALFRGESSQLHVEGVAFQANQAESQGGAISVHGESIEVVLEAATRVSTSRFSGNQSNGVGCDVHIDVEGSSGQRADIFMQANIFDDSCPGAALAHDEGAAFFLGNTFSDSGGGTVVVSSPGASEWYRNIISARLALPMTQSNAGGSPNASCDDTGSTLASLGYNISWDATCNFDQATDLVSTDPMLSVPDENGIRAPLPDSPAIDHGPSAVSDPSGNGTLRLPCGYRDINGLGAPQDGDGDGEFECDSGAVEVQGPGAIEAGHSGAFFNAARNGEGQYVEILAGGERAIIYTFSYKPDGGAAAWFIAVANVVGNSLVSDELLRPFGTRWGEDFVADDIDFSEAGGMSMVLPDCDGDPVGNVAYSGSAELGFEPLITRAQRLGDIFGCAGSDITPHPDASRSGSYFDPARNGEGLIIEWLPDGRVVVVMFTFDPNGQQMWMIGVGDSAGDSVTVEALYPTGFSQWGSGFDAGDVVLETWGTFSLTWTDEDHVTFDYSSTAQGYDSATRNYQRLSTLEEP